MRSERITFIGADGTSLLAARLDRPAGVARAHALFAHCFTCTHNVLAATRIADALADRGIAVLRFDFTGLGASEGEFANTNFSSNVGDLLAAAAWMRETLQAPKLLIGHSLGGAAVLAAAKGIPEALAVATIAAPAEPSQVVKLFQQAVPEIEARGEAAVLLEGRPFRIKKQFLDDIEANRPHSAGHCCCSTRRATRSSASTTRPESSARPDIRRASSRSTTPTTCCRGARIRSTWRE
jgi:alpha/beta superfamily hydrolase